MPISDETRRTLERIREDMTARYEAEKANKRTRARRARRKRAQARGTVVAAAS